MVTRHSGVGVLHLSRGVCAAPVEVEVVVCEEHPRQVMVGTAVGLTLAGHRQVKGAEPQTGERGGATEREKKRKAASYGDCRAEVVRALVETGHVKRPLVFPLQTHSSSGLAKLS